MIQDEQVFCYQSSKQLIQQKEKKQQRGQDNLRLLLSKRTSIDVISYETPSVYLDMNCSQGIKKYKFFIGILKPGQKWIGLIAINRNKLSIAGIFGDKIIQKVTL
ncbi:unnamed protein product (macronuclear) [Paramecium tetraurelia]|uniref:Uncharacterized protein n=1 Tax=Paramecium tetraurelia TaxID=5888 RepID=A0DXQ0_PARTE|nr:uncharacterized protein GSPATT00021441001 [Paramecium tetraurelia]CAK87817.1 unnamed protein product [Paramecium tetraurelia]|eukprot:XP_001455214.1 hypothetical protein (macronuclear) [Paramecium tetraurelia strain d4-2]